MRLEDRTIWPWVPAAFITAGIALYFVADSLVTALTGLMPFSAEVRSNGTHFGSFTEVGPDIIRRTGVLVVVAAVLSQLPFHRLRSIGSRARPWWLLAALSAVVAVWIGWLATPHNAFPSNSRIHWVDIFFDRIDNFFYAAVKLPHFVFYDRPYLWQSINAILICLLFFEAGRRMKLPLAASLGMGATVAISGNLLLFANTAEDVFLNVAILLLVFVALLTGRPVPLGLALALVVLGRPPFLLLIFAVLGGVILAYLRRSRSVRELPWRFLIVTGLVALVAVVACQVAFELFGDRYFLVDGALISASSLENLDALEVDGFFISAFSGAYLGHALWIFPLPLLVGAAAGLLQAHRRSVEVEGLVYACALGILAMLFVNESKPLLYYNMRYLTYYLPMLMLMAWSLWAPLEQRPTADTSAPLTAFRSAAFAVLLLAPMMIPADPIGDKRANEQRMEHELTEISDDINELAEDGELHVQGVTATRNFVAYTLRRDVSTIKILAPDEVPESGVAIVRKGEGGRADGFDGAIALETENFAVIVLDE